VQFTFPLIEENDMSTHPNSLCRRSFTQRLLTAVLVFAGGSLSASAQTSGLTDVTFSVGSTSFGYGSLFIAESAGLFRKHGINPKMIISESGNAATTALIAGSVDFACSGPDQVLTARSRGRDILLVGNLYRGAFGSLAVGPKLVAAAGPNPTKEAKIKILEGRTIATPSATSAYTASMQRTARLMGVNIKYTYMSQPAMAAALASGAVDGVMAGSPFSDAAIRASGGKLWLSGPGGDFPEEVAPASSAVLQTTAAYAQKNPKVMAAVLAVFADLAVLIKSNPAEAKAAFRAFYKNADPTLIDSIFEQNGPAWTAFGFSEADVKREIGLLAAQRPNDGLEKLDATKVVYRPR